ncbi:MAG TPA: hypothetical protein VEQ85_05385 [Lacipirellulaceae bacterium]|nr:hypothetical protein [Lacipirellulaceae bacterium]
MKRSRAIGFGVAATSIVVIILLALAPPEGDAVDVILRDMTRQRVRFDPAPLDALNHEQLKTAFRRMMEDSREQIGPGPGYFEFVRETHFAPAWTNFVNQVHDQSRLALIASLAVEGYKPGVAWGDRKMVLDASLHAVVQTKDDAVIGRLAPLLSHQDFRVWKALMNELRQVREDPSYYPALYFLAMDSGNPRIVEEALRWAPNCWDMPKRGKLLQSLRKVYDGMNEELKFQSCFPLMFDFNDQDAIAYLVEQTRSSDPDRARRAVTWLGDSCNSGRPAQPGVVEAIRMHLASRDPLMQSAAKGAMATYAEQPIGQ